MNTARFNKIQSLCNELNDLLELEIEESDEIEDMYLHDLVDLHSTLQDVFLYEFVMVAADREE